MPKIFAVGKQRVGLIGGLVDSSSIKFRERFLSPEKLAARAASAPVRLALDSTESAMELASRIVSVGGPFLETTDELLVQVIGLDRRLHAEVAYLASCVADACFDTFPRQLSWWSSPLANSANNPLLLAFDYPDLAQLCQSENI